MSDRNCLTWWLGKLQAAGLPVPRTEVADAGEDWDKMLAGIDPDEGRRCTPAHRAGCELLGRVAAEIIAAAERLGIGYPFFLRTGQGSGKHAWDDCCHVQSAEVVPERVANLINWSECVDFFGLSWRYWAVREMLPVEPAGVLPAYGNMPLVVEARCFVEGGRVLCAHPYWPLGAVRQGLERPDEAGARRLFEAADPAPWRDEWMPLAVRVAETFAGDGAWSVDLLRTRRGWVVTDMAEAARSYHYEGCQRAEWEVGP